MTRAAAGSSRPRSAGISVSPGPGFAPRACGRGYYRDVCFKVSALADGAPAEETGDGGFTDWTAKLLANSKERLLISGYGLERLAMLIDDQGTRG